MKSGPHAAQHGHAFISYVREDGRRVDRLQQFLETNGVPVWRDTDSLWPGEDWRAKIREAIATDSLAFIACFSKNSEARQQSYQKDELLLAIEQLRLRSPDKPYLLPVRFDNCTIPDIQIGAGRTLDSLQRVDLFGQQWQRNAERLVEGVKHVLDFTATRTPKHPRGASRFRRYLQALLSSPWMVTIVGGLIVAIGSALIIPRILAPPGHSPIKTSAAIESGYYVNAGPNFPHWFILLNSSNGTEFSGTIAFLYQDGQTGLAQTFSGNVSNGLMTLNLSHSGTQTATIGSYRHRTTLFLGECGRYLKFITSVPQCSFAHAADMSGDQH